jgi:hypothetical protein
VSRRKLDITEEYQARTRSRPPRSSGAGASDVIVIGGVRATFDEHAKRHGMPVRLLLERSMWPEHLLDALLRAHDPARLRATLAEIV